MRLSRVTAVWFQTFRVARMQTTVFDHKCRIVVDRVVLRCQPSVFRLLALRRPRIGWVMGSGSAAFHLSTILRVGLA